MISANLQPVSPNRGISNLIWLPDLSALSYPSLSCSLVKTPPFQTVVTLTFDDHAAKRIPFIQIKLSIGIIEDGSQTG